MAVCRGASNEYPQHMFLSRNKKNIMWIPPLCSYVCNKVPSFRGENLATFFEGCKKGFLKLAYPLQPFIAGFHSLGIARQVWDKPRPGYRGWPAESEPYSGCKC